MMIGVLQGHRRRRLTYFLPLCCPSVRRPPSAVSVVVALRAPILTRSDRRRVPRGDATSGRATMWPSTGVGKDVSRVEGTDSTCETAMSS